MKNMLIDATHQEEVRVAVVDGKRLVEFDYESKVRKQIKGGVYLAKVTRIEPSLQAAFVNYGGNRHGFLPFSEIHPDYFRIPVSDREALIEAQKAELERIDNKNQENDDDADLVEDEDDAVDAKEGGIEVVEDEEEEVVEVGGADKPADDEDEDLVSEKSKKKPAKKTKAKKSSPKTADENDEPDEDNIGNVKADVEEKSDEELDAEAEAKLLGKDSNNKKANNNRGRNNRGRNNKRSEMRRGKSAELVNDKEENQDDGKPFRFNLRHKYKIQEVLKRGQIMLIQVSKEERGNKGAAVTTYVSLPGRYCVLMPNSPRGGGVSRKIGNFKDRKRMREILKDLTIPEGMSVILRTAGVARTKAEIKRDLDYLTRLWNTIREDTLKSSAPALINEEGNLIKRSIRDLYTRDIENVYVAGEKGHKTAREFMNMLVPSHAKKVKEYTDAKVPLFHKYNVEKQISEIGEIQVHLKSGGSLVINPTEALVSIDVNSGKATKERHIEETALKTNLEAAEEVARQLRLRDLGGLVVIDFIDMMERRNNRKVENRLRDALSDDRARIQVGRISSFGLLELSRQRLNPSLTEAQFETCPECSGRGSVMTMDFAAITAMRSLEEEGIRNKATEISLSLPNNVAVYILNHKRDMLADIEARYEFRVHVRVDESLHASEFKIDILQQDDSRKPHKAKKDVNENYSDDNDQNNNDDQPKRSRRRGRRGGRRRNQNRDNSENTDSNINQERSEKSDDQPVEKVESKKETKKTSAKKSAKKTAKKAVKSSKAEKADDVQGDTKQETKKTSAKKSTKKTAKKVPNKKTTKPSNDTQPPKSEEKKDYEVVNAAPEKPKKGWWNKLVD